MQRRFTVLLIALLMVAQLPLLSAGAAAGDYILAGFAAPDQVIIAFDPASGEAERDAIIAGRGGRTLERFDGINARLVEVSQVQATLADVGNEPGVRYAQPNFTYSLDATPDDPEYSRLWGLNNTGQTQGVADADIDAPEAWGVTTGSRNIVVGVVDTGILYTHPDLVNNIWTAPEGWNVKGCGAGTHGYRSDRIESTSCDPIDENGHGTHVAGTIGATGNNGLGVVGVNWQVQLMALRSFDAGGNASTAGTIRVIDYAVQAKRAGVNLRVINASWGGILHDQALLDEIDALNDEGILLVAAAGNGGIDPIGDDNGVTPNYPANYGAPPYNRTNIIAVAATDRNDALATFSNYGATTVHLGAPGVNIYSTLLRDGYDSKNGTSMATPHVAGAAALLLSVTGLGSMGPADLRTRLMNCGDPIPALAGKTISGKRLNVNRAVRDSDGCAPVPTCDARFSDMDAGDPGCAAVANLAARGVVHGYAGVPAKFGPDDPVQRAQAATFIARALGWQWEATGPRTFSDFDGLVRELRDGVLVLANRCAELAGSDICVARGYTDGRFGPGDPVSYAQVIAFIARAFMLEPRYGWEAQSGGVMPYASVPAAHAVSVCTFYRYAGAIPNAPTTAAGWNAAAPRAWVALVLWQALALER